MNDDLGARALERLRTALDNPNATFHDGQLEAIEAIVRDRARVLLVQRTGWGKSMVYFIATALLREAGMGTTLIVSPLLALMRNQVEAARRLGLRAETLTSENPDDWDRIFAEVRAGEVDLLLVSPERLTNAKFEQQAGATLFERLGMLVVDEAHCISDWGHDFRPHYRLIARYIRFLPPNVPILATTATADDAVVDDVRDQLGEGVRVERGPLMRESLQLDVVDGLSYARRLAWLAEVVPALPGSGIIYALTHRDADIVTQWLGSRGIDAEVYYSDNRLDRVQLEQRLLDDQVKALVATSALGMGFDKGNLGFVIHFQSTASVVHYYQQAGRAGRAIENAVCVLLGGPEDDDIHESFVRNALPSEELIDAILGALSESDEGLSINGLTAAINAPKGKIEHALRFLRVQPQSPVVKTQNWGRTAVRWEYPREHADALAARRRAQRVEMQRYADGGRCLMQRLAEPLGDATVAPCGRCSACIGEHVLAWGDLDGLTAEAEDFLNRRPILIEERKQWPAGDNFPAYGFRGKIPPELRAQPGSALAYYGFGTIGRRIKHEKYHVGAFSGQTIRDGAAAIRAWYGDAPLPAWIAPMVSRRHPTLVPDFARGLAAELGVRFVEPLRKTRDTPEQKTMENANHQARNLDGSLEVLPFDGMEQPGMFVDDMSDSRWTSTVVAALLCGAGTGPVTPFALAKQSDKAEDD